MEGREGAISVLSTKGIWVQNFILALEMAYLVFVMEEVHQDVPLILGLCRSLYNPLQYCFGLFLLVELLTICLS